MTFKKRYLLAIVRPNETVAKFLVLLLLAGLLALGLWGYLDPIRLYLDDDRFSFTIFKQRLSPWKLLETIVVFVVTLWIAGLFSAGFESRLRRIRRLGVSNRILITKIAQFLIYTILIMLALNVVGIDLTALAVFSGALGIGIGIGLQKIASNFISGIILLLEKSVEVGDLIELEDGAIGGFVKHTTARYTLIEDFHGKEIMVPNEDFITNRVNNLTLHDTKGRIDIPIGVSYNSDLEQVQRILLEAAQAHPLALKDPSPACFLREFGESSVNFLLTFWIEDVADGRFGPQHDVMMDIWKRFKTHGIEIPFPQRVVHLMSSAHG